MSLNLKLQMRLSQQLIMTPQLQQAIKLLQLSRTELEELIQQALIENPVLDESTYDDDGPAAEADGPAVETVVDRSQVNLLIPQLKKSGAEDILELAISKIVP